MSSLCSYLSSGVQDRKEKAKVSNSIAFSGELVEIPFNPSLTIHSLNEYYMKGFSIQFVNRTKIFLYFKIQKLVMTLFGLV